jgi:hypothetical protein
MAARILICSRHDDMHALIVAAALRQLGAEAEIWDLRDFPSQRRISIHYPSGGSVKVSVEHLPAHATQRYEAVWLRRIAWDGRACDLAGKQLDLPEVHAAIFIDHILDLFPQDIRWINAFPHAIRAEYKPVQLAIAGRVGFNVPETLISNDPKAIRAFIATLGGTVVAKPLRAEVATQCDGSLMSLRAELVDASRLPSDQALEVAPYIFQRKLDALFEVRVTVMGDRIFCARMDAQGGDHLIDSHYKTTSATEFTVPTNISKLCRTLGRDLDLSFFCVDLLVTKDGTFHFLEINQAGQFLWLEREIPRYECLAAFCALLLGTPEPPQVRLESILASPELKARRQAA